jgi:hypothetical protein
VKCIVVVVCLFVRWLEGSGRMILVSMSDWKSEKVLMLLSLGVCVFMCDSFAECGLNDQERERKRYIYSYH